MKKNLFPGLLGLLVCLPFAAYSQSQTDPKQALMPAGWDAALAGDQVMERLVNTTAPRVKGAHDAEFVCVGDRAYVVAEVNDEKSGESAGWPFIYATMSVLNLKTLAVEKVIDFAKGEQVFENETLPVGACFVPRILQKSHEILRCYFTSEDPGQRQSQLWFRDFDMKSGEFLPTIHRAQLKTATGTFDFQPKHFHADAVAQGFSKPAVDSSFFLFDSFKKFDGKTYVAINNFTGKQNALALVHDDLATFEILGHFNEPQSEQLSESAVNRLPDGTWIAICRNDGGNYHFTTSTDGREWTEGKELPFVSNGANSKPTFDKFGGVYYLGWQEATKIQGVSRSVFNIDISRDGKTWARKYRFETPKSFQYPTFHEHDGTIWLNATQGDTSPSRKERIMFGELEKVGEFESQAGKQRIASPEAKVLPALMKRGVKLFTDRDYLIDEMPEALGDLPFLRTSIEKTDVVITKPGTLYALTPTIRPNAASQENALKESGFSKSDVREVQLFPGEVNRVSLYRKEVKKGDHLKFRKLVLLIKGAGVELQDFDPLAAVDARTEPPVIITDPGAEFQDDARPGAMIIGMDRTPKGRIWGCWTGTGDKYDGYFVLATSDDDGSSWSKPRLVVGAADPSGKRTRAAPPQSQQDRRADKQPLKKRIPISNADRSVRIGREPGSIRGVKFTILLRSNERKVRATKSHRVEKRLFLLASGEESSHLAGHSSGKKMIVRHVRRLHHRAGPAIRDDRFAIRICLVKNFEHFPLAARPWRSAPVFGDGPAIVIDLAKASGLVSLIPKPARDRDGISATLAKGDDVIVAMIIDPNGSGAQTGHEGQAGEAALGIVAVGLFKQHRLLRELINVRRLDPLVAIASKHRSEVIDRDHEDVRSRRLVRGDEGCEKKESGEKKGPHDWER